jgi:hypothetical protein
MKALLAVLLLTLFIGSAHGQAKDSTETILKVHSPKKAALYSAILPGLGQAYNKRWWKLPLVYGAIGTSVYFIIDNNKNYNSFRDEYLFRLDNPGSSNTGFENYTDANLITIQDQYRRWRDLSYIFCGIAYALNIVDAAVDAHLIDFNKKINDDLSLHIHPYINISTQTYSGLTFSVKL